MTHKREKLGFCLSRLLGLSPSGIQIIGLSVKLFLRFEEFGLDSLKIVNVEVLTNDTGELAFVQDWRFVNFAVDVLNLAEALPCLCDQPVVFACRRCFLLG